MTSAAEPFKSASQPPFPHELSVHMNEEERQQFFWNATNYHIAQVREYFQRNGYVVAECVLDYLIKLKGSEYRSNGYVPSILHEIEQLLPVITSFENGMLKRKKKRIEREHGSVEIYFCKILAHDIGEEFNDFPDDLLKNLQNRVQEKQGYPPTPDQENTIFETAQGMETLAHYRKFTLGDFETFTGDQLPPEVINLGEGEVFDLSQYQDFFCGKMHRWEGDNLKPRIFAHRKPGKETPKIIVTAYGQSSQHAMDWASHMYILFQNAYDIMTKIGDRNTGVPSRIGMKDKSIDEHDVFLNETEQVFQFIGSRKILKHAFLDSPLNSFWESKLNMLGLLVTMARFVINHHPDRNPPGSRGFDPKHYKWHDVLGDITPLNLSELFLSAMKAYEHMPLYLNPLYIFMFQLKDYTFTLTGNERKIMEDAYNTIKSSLEDHGGEQVEQILRLLESTNGAIAPSSEHLLDRHP